MPLPDLLRDGERQMRICNACRYCEGYCAVFPAMELRRGFAEADLVFLANLCFDCRDCYYACQYAPPHEFGVNIPKLMAELRAQTYRELTWPAVLSGLFRRNAAGVALITVGVLLIITVLLLALSEPGVLFASHVGEGSFYRVVPYVAMTVPALLIALGGLGVLVAGAVRFWRQTGAGVREGVNVGAFWRATRDTLGLTYLGGGGAGCNYPDAHFSQSRRWLHHLVFYGFGLDLAATTVAAFYEHVLGRTAPYPLLSWPVMLGTVGGIGLLVGTAGLLYLKWKGDRDPAAAPMRGMDLAFLVLLFLTSLSGLLLLALRETSGMATLLAIHLGVVAGLFLTLPYGKFVHVGYRYLALVKHAIEQRRDEAGAHPPGSA